MEEDEGVRVIRGQPGQQFVGDMHTYYTNMNSVVVTVFQIIIKISC